MMYIEECLTIVEKTINKAYDKGQKDMLSRCISGAESMLGSPTEDDLQKFIIWLRNENQDDQADQG